MNESPVSLGDRLKAAIVAIVRELDPYREYAGFHEYRVLAGTSLTGWALRKDRKMSSPALICRLRYEASAVPEAW